MIKTLCVFCGSSMGSSPLYKKSAVAFAQTLCRAGVDLVYGGSSIGLMGTLARTMLEGGRHVTGIIPTALHEAAESLDVNDLIIVDTMHQRKAAMYEKADAFTALPGGIGTFEEILEAFTWSQLGYLQKPVSLLNTAGYYDLLIKQLRHSVEEGFLKQSRLDNFIICSSPEDLLRSLNQVSIRETP